METIYAQSIYLGVAVNVVKDVQTLMTIGSSNQLGRNYAAPWKMHERMSCVAQTRDSIVKDLAAKKASGAAANVPANKLMVETWALWAKANGCGNCGEQSALSFVTIRDNYRRFPIDWMHIDNFAHGFVVLGRIGATDPTRPSTWNSEAVVCDPYFGEAVAASACKRLKGAVTALLWREEE